MKLRKKNDITILLFALLIFSFGIGWIYSKTTPDKNQKNIIHATNIKTNIATPEKIKIKTKKIKETPKPPEEIKATIPKETFNIEETLEYLKEWVNSKSMHYIIKTLKETCPKDKIVEVLNRFIKENINNLSREEKIKIIVALGHHYKNDKTLQFKVFDIIAKYKKIEEGDIPLLFVAVQEDEKEAINDIIQWYKKSGRPKTRGLAKQTLEYAAKNDYIGPIKKLHEIGVAIDNDYATKLLQMAIKSNKGAKSIEFLKSLGADLDSSDPKTKFTLLIQAIKNKNFKVVKALIREGANVKKPSEDKSIGYPLQIARELNQIDIELFLRSKGARD